MTGRRTMLAAVAVSTVTFVFFGGIARAAAPTATTGPATAIGATLQQALEEEPKLAAALLQSAVERLSAQILS
jgi:hypothetical protein